VGHTSARAHLVGAILLGAILLGAILDGAILREADLSGADLRRADLSGTSRRSPHTRRADPFGSGTDLRRAHIERANFGETILGNTDLSHTIGLDSCEHTRPSTVDYQTLGTSHPLPVAFLRGVGLPDRLIDYLPSLLGEAIQYFACFISYSSNDHMFAERLYNDLQGNGAKKYEKVAASCSQSGSLTTTDCVIGNSSTPTPARTSALRFASTTSPTSQRGSRTRRLPVCP